MTISISDATRNVIFHETGDVSIPAEMRGAITQTLDGGGFVVNLGSGYAGIEFQINAVLTKAQAATLRAITDDATLVYISTLKGAFKGYIKRFAISGNSAIITIWTNGVG